MTALTSLLFTVLCAPQWLGVRDVSPDTSTQRVTPLRPSAQRAALPGNAHPTVQPAKGTFLVASRTLADPNFSETVVLLLSYDEHGAVGVIINQPTDVRLASALPDIKELRNRSDRVYRGGPVAPHLMLLLVRSAAQPEPSESIFADVYASGSLKVLHKALAKSGKRSRLRGYAGHAGWGAGQLDMEIARSDWIVTAADAATIFDLTPSDVWPKLIERLSGEWTRAPLDRHGRRTTVASMACAEPRSQLQGGLQ
jgi:putative transcriptional regulator